MDAMREVSSAACYLREQFSAVRGRRLLFAATSSTPPELAEPKLSAAPILPDVFDDEIIDVIGKAVETAHLAASSGRSR
jgi:hypothetical protein